VYNKDSILSRLEAAITEQPAPVPMSGDRWLVSSALQKSIRRGHVEPALRAATSLWHLDRQNFWKRLHIVAMEDCSADADVVVSVLTATVSSAWRKKRGELQVALYLTRLLCTSVKSRAADELYMQLERSSAHKDLRERYAAADDALLVDRVIDEDGLLTERAMALFYLAGTKKFPSDAMPHRKGDPESAKKVLRELNAPGDMVESCIAVMARTYYPLSIFTPLVWQAVQRQGDGVHIAHDAIAPCPDVEGIPLVACDVYTRIGQSCFRELQKAVPALKQYSVRQIGVAVFNAEGGLLDRYITSPFLQALRQAGEYAYAESTGLSPSAYAELRECLAANTDMLTSIRQEALRQYLSSMSISCTGGHL